MARIYVNHDERDTAELHCKVPARKVVLKGALFRCTECTQIKPASAFGLRLDKQTVRNQPQCKECRSEQGQARRQS
jgi:hypothetical protein